MLSLQKRAHLESYILQYKQINGIYLGSVFFFAQKGKPAMRSNTKTQWVIESTDSPNNEITDFSLFKVNPQEVMWTQK